MAAAAPMAQPTTEPVEEYECVSRDPRASMQCRIADSLSSYEALPPNFSLLQNMTAGAFAGIAVRPLSRNTIMEMES